jgi:hypothetical protein
MKTRVGLTTVGQILAALELAEKELADITRALQDQEHWVDTATLGAVRDVLAKAAGRTHTPSYGVQQAEALPLVETGQGDGKRGLFGCAGCGRVYFCAADLSDCPCGGGR